MPSTQLMVPQLGVVQTGAAFGKQAPMQRGAGLLAASRPQAQPGEIGVPPQLPFSGALPSESSVRQPVSVLTTQSEPGLLGFSQVFARVQTMPSTQLIVPQFGVVQNRGALGAQAPVQRGAGLPFESRPHAQPGEIDAVWQVPSLGTPPLASSVLQVVAVLTTQSVPSAGSQVPLAERVKFGLHVQRAPTSVAAHWPHKVETLWLELQV